MLERKFKPAVQCSELIFHLIYECYIMLKKELYITPLKYYIVGGSDISYFLVL